MTRQLSALLLAGCGNAELAERVSRLEADNATLETEVSELRDSLGKLRTALNTNVTVPVRDAQPSNEATVVSIDLDSDRLELAGEQIELEDVGPRLQELTSDLRVVIVPSAATPHDRVVQLIDCLRAHEIRQFAIRAAGPLE